MGMQMITIDRWYRQDCTLGIFTVDKFRCFSLELPDNDNQQDISCIPEGTYGYYLRNSPKNGLILELKLVINRDYIQIHSGNFTRQILGCILVGESIKYLDSDSIPDVTNSKATLKKVLAAAGKSGKIEIRG